MYYRYHTDIQVEYIPETYPVRFSIARGTSTQWRYPMRNEMCHHRLTKQLNPSSSIHNCKIEEYITMKKNTMSNADSSLEQGSQKTKRKKKLWLKYSAIFHVTMSFNMYNSTPIIYRMKTVAIH